MFITLATILLYTVQILMPQCQSLRFLELSDREFSTKDHTEEQKEEAIPPVKYEPYPMDKLNPKRRYWLVHDPPDSSMITARPRVYEDEKDANLKNKISVLVQQTMHDTERRMKSIQQMKEDYREEAPYRAGFILSMVKKSKDVLDELFNVAVRHRDEWMALEQLKIFELIVHTNVDTTNLLRQLVDLHVKHLNATNSDKKRVILI